MIPNLSQNNNKPDYQLGIDNYFKTLYSGYMARRSASFVSPIDPRMHFPLFLIMVLILVIFVGAVLQNTSADARAFLFCPKNNTDHLNQIKACEPYGYTLGKDTNGCTVVLCDSTNVQGATDEVPPPGYTH